MTGRLRDGDMLGPGAPACLAKARDYDPLMAVAVSDNSSEDRYEVSSDGELAGFAIYRRRPGIIAFVHTEIDDRFEREGLGTRLVHDALDDARRESLAVLPFCPFVNGYIKRHPEYRDLVPEDYREKFGL